MKQQHYGKMLIVFGLAIALAMIVGSTVFAAGPSGLSPNDPLMVPPSAFTIAPNTTLWFYFDYTADTAAASGFAFRSFRPGGRPAVQIAVDANGTPGLQFGVYTPQLAKDWLNDSTTAPVGRGTPYTDTSNDLVTHDLFWQGAFNQNGRYFVAVTNTNATPISFRMTVTGETVMLYPTPAPSPTPTLFVPITVTPVPTGTLQGKILFETATGGDIYSVNGDGTNLKRLTHGIDPAWSPDGKQIVFTRWDNTAPGVYIANADGSNEQLIFGTPRARWAHLSPDGKYVVFSQDKSKTDANPIWKLGVVELATGKLTEPQCSQLCFVPTWSKDSTTIVYTDPNLGIFSTSILGGPASLILGPTGMYWDATKNAALPILHMPPIQNSVLSPDGKTVAYSQQAHDRWEINVVNRDGSNQAGVTTYDPIQYVLLGIAAHNVAPVWSPDSQQILFLSDRNGKWEFFVIDPSGTNLRQVLKNVTDAVPVKFTFENEQMMDWAK
jgi:TolB protein